MKAIMRDNLVERYKSVMPKEYDAEIGAFLRSIEGKEVELRFIGTDAFEVNDNSIWLPDCLWDECTSNPKAHVLRSSNVEPVVGTLNYRKDYCYGYELYAMPRDGVFEQRATARWVA